MKLGSIIAGIVALIIFFLFRTTPMVSGIIVSVFYLQPVGWFLAIAAIVMFLASAAVYDNQGYGETKHLGPLSIGIVLTIAWIIWASVVHPVRMAALSKHTLYDDQNVTLTAQNEVRPYPYAIAAANIATAKYDGTTAAGDLDYVQDRWTASIDPNSFWVQLYRPTQGVFVMNNNYTVDPVIQPFTFSERGILWNHAVNTIRSHEYFVEFSDVLYVKQDDGRYLAVTTLIKRAGFSRFPYIYGIAVVSSEGLVEILPPSVAETDPRLQGVQLIPYGFETLRTEAYGWRNGWISGIFSRKTRVTVHSSSVNAENAAPFHFKSMLGNTWYTPLSPLGSRESVVAIAMSDSHDINGPVKIWKTEPTKPLPGTDFIGSLIESSPNHSNMVWFHGGDSKCGNAALLEIVPVIRQEAQGSHLYFMGYISSVSVSSNVRFYTIMDPATRVVYEDLPSYEYVNQWLQGQFELTPVTQTSISIDPTTGQCLSPDLSQESDQALIDYLRKVTEELDRRLQK